MAGNRYRACSILGIVAWFAASCTSAPAPDPEPAEQPASPTEAIYLKLSDADREAVAAALQEALETLPSSQALTWYGADGVTGLITPLRTFKIKTGHFCRDFTEAIVRQAVPLSVASRACRTDQGRWLRVAVPQSQA